MIRTPGLTLRLQVWELRTGICVKTLRGHTAPVLAIQAEADRLVSGGGDKTIRVWQVDRAGILTSAVKRSIGNR